MSSDVYELDAITCLNDSNCWLVGAQPQTENDIVMATSNWGGSWTVQDRSSVGASMGVSYGISCPSTYDCGIVASEHSPPPRAALRAAPTPRPAS